MKRRIAGSLGGFALVTLTAAVALGGCSSEDAAPAQAPVEVSFYFPVAPAFPK